jgi:hypothetical protein
MANTVIDSDGFSIESSHETEDEMRAALAPSDDAATKKPGVVDKLVDAVIEDRAKPAADDKKPDDKKPDDKKRPNRSDDPNRAVQTAVQKQREAERLAADEKARADRLEAENARLRQPAAREPNAAPAAAAAPGAKPTTTAEYQRYRAMPDAPQFDKFEDSDDFVAAMSLFIFDKRQEEQHDRDFETHRKTTWQERLAAKRATDPDFDSKLDPTTPATQQMRDYVADSELGPDILLHLSAHKDLAQRISTLHPSHVDREMGKIEGELQARLSAAQSLGPASAPVLSSARRVTKPVTGAPIVSDDDMDDGDRPIEDFIRRANKAEGKPFPTAHR